MLDFGAKQSLPTVLLIDDDPVSREVIATVLTLSGFSLYTARDGGTALKMLTARECAPDAILMDAQMPGLSGARLIGKLRKRSKARLIVISGSAAPGEIVAAADGFLLKPFDAEGLNQLLQAREPEADASGARNGIVSETGVASAGPAAADTAASDSQQESEPVRNTDAPVVSAETLAQLRQIMPEAGVREIFAAIVADLGTRLKALDAAFERGDAAEVRRIGHAIKGGCGMAGALQAARLGALLEAAGLNSKSNHLDNSAGLLDDLRAAARNLERMLKSDLIA
jgi:CheY-like chemotaxis protein